MTTGVSYQSKLIQQCGKLLAFHSAHGHEWQWQAG